MLNPRLAGRYAKSLVDISVEKGILEALYNDMQFLKTLMKVSPDFTIVLKSPVISSDKKNKILKAITQGKINPVTAAFTELLISKNREFYLPEIVDAFIDQYNVINNIHIVKLTTATPVSDGVKEAILNKLKGEADLGNVELETVVKENIIGGFVLEFDNKIVDASIIRELNELKKQFRDNIYVQQIR